MDKSVIVILVIGLVIIWIFASSIGTLIRISRGGASGSFGPPIRINIQQPPVVLPPINITIPQHVNLTKANEIYVPLVPIPVIIPNIPMNIIKYITLNPPKPQILRVSSGSSAQGISIGSGSSRALSNAASVTFSLPPMLMIVLLISIILVIATSSLVVLRGFVRDRSSTTNESSRRYASKVELGKRLMSGEVTRSLINVGLLPNEVVVDLKGWTGSPVIDLGISKDLPLIWGYGDPLPISWREGYTVSVVGPGMIKDGFLYMPKPGCYGVRAEGNGYVETLFIRAVDYNEDVARLVKLNVSNYGLEDSLTIREAVRRLINDGVLSGGPDVDQVIRVFEEVRYGLRRVDRARYEEFLRTLGRAFRDAKVIVCGGS
ncbi:MAG: DUF4129 domain-containing protein [Vulcanisaeta sp. AZ3]